MAKPSFDPQIYKRLPGLVLGFHGCDEAVGMKLLSGGSHHLKKARMLMTGLEMAYIFGRTILSELGSLPKSR